VTGGGCDTDANAEVRSREVRSREALVKDFTRRFRGNADGLGERSGDRWWREEVAPASLF
jgi:hypothetical protein